MHQIFYCKAPKSMIEIFPQLSGENRAHSFLSRAPLTSALQNFPSCNLIKIWNNLSLTHKSTESFSSFKMAIIDSLIVKWCESFCLVYIYKRQIFSPLNGSVSAISLFSWFGFCGSPLQPLSISRFLTRFYVVLLFFSLPLWAFNTPVWVS